MSLQRQALCQESLSLFFLENFSSFKIPIWKSPLHEATLDTRVERVTLSSYFLGPCTHISHINSCHTVLKYTVTLSEAPSNLSEGSRVGVGGAWALDSGRAGFEPGRLCPLLLCYVAWSLNLAEFVSL